jgi:hypothetical protein
MPVFMSLHVLSEFAEILLGLLAVVLSIVADKAQDGLGFNPDPEYRRPRLYERVVFLFLGVLFISDGVRRLMR